MKIFPLKPMSDFDKLKNLIKIMKYNQEINSKTASKISNYNSRLYNSSLNNTADKFVKNSK